MDDALEAGREGERQILQASLDQRDPIEAWGQAGFRASAKTSWPASCRAISTPIFPVKPVSRIFIVSSLFGHFEHERAPA